MQTYSKELAPVGSSVSRQNATLRLLSPSLATYRVSRSSDPSTLIVNTGLSLRLAALTFALPFVATRLLSLSDRYRPAPPSAVPDGPLIARADCLTDQTHGAYPADSACLDAPPFRLAGLCRTDPFGDITAVVLPQAGKTDYSCSFGYCKD
jgi:hypothetical protein